MSNSKRLTRSRAALIANQRRGRFLEFSSLRAVDGSAFTVSRSRLRDGLSARFRRHVGTPLAPRASRQVEKSTLLSNRIVYEVLRHPGIKILLCSPRLDQAFLFSRTRLHPVVQESQYSPSFALAASPPDARQQHLFSQRVGTIRPASSLP